MTTVEGQAIVMGMTKLSEHLSSIEEEFVTAYLASADGEADRIEWSTRHPGMWASGVEADVRYRVTMVWRAMVSDVREQERARHVRLAESIFLLLLAMATYSVGQIFL